MTTSSATSGATFAQDTSLAAAFALVPALQNVFLNQAPPPPLPPQPTVKFSGHCLFTLTANVRYMLLFRCQA